MKPKPKPKRRRKPQPGLTRNRPLGSGLQYGEPTKALSVRLPLSQVDLLDALGPNRNAALIGIIRTSVQYRMEYGSELENDG
jgi:hypothetical protein